MNWCKRLGWSVVFALIVTVAWGQTVDVPKKIEVQPGRLAAVTVEWDGDDVKWRASPALDIFREYDPDAKKVRLRLIGYTPGSYDLIVVVAKGGKLSEFAVCQVVVAGDAPAPPGPPVPPPGPLDPLTKYLQEAYDLDQDEDKAKHKSSLAALYRQAAKLDLNAIGTSDELSETLKKAAATLLPVTVLTNTRRAISTQLKEVLPGPGEVLTQDHRANFKGLATRLAKSLEVLK